MIGEIVSYIVMGGFLLWIFGSAYWYVIRPELKKVRK